MQLVVITIDCQMVAMTVTALAVFVAVFVIVMGVMKGVLTIVVLMVGSVEMIRVVGILRLWVLELLIIVGNENASLDCSVSVRDISRGV